MTSIRIEGAGIAGQVLHRELYLKGIPSTLADPSSFPRDKVCGGTLQWDSWRYLNSIFPLQEKIQMFHSIRHFWRGKPIASHALKNPMVYLSRYALDDALNRCQESLPPASGEAIRILAAGASSENTDWMGFQGSADPVDGLEMHYGKEIYLGLAPTPEGPSHAAFVMKRRLFKGVPALRDYLKKELGIRVGENLKGMKGISYRAASKNAFAVGDAKLATHPFLGLGMKHAILSARLLASLIAENRLEEYPQLHARLFRKYRWANRFAGSLYDSPFRFTLAPILKNRILFQAGYHWLHS